MDSLTTADLQSGRPWPLGASWDGQGINFAVFSAHGHTLELCLFDDSGTQELRRLPLPGHTGDIWHGYLPEGRPGLVYGLRAHGPWRPDQGHRFNAAKLLLDPHARAVTGGMQWSGPNLVDSAAPFELDPRDTAALVPKAVMVPDAAVVAAGPGIPWERTILYEAHVRGLTKLHPGVPEPLRGTYLGLAEPAVLDHLVKLGITAVELMPVAAFIDELRLTRLGLSNYWGYNPVAFMAAEPRFAVRDPMAEFRAMVAALHGAGIEVILDVVLNHTANILLWAIMGFGMIPFLEPAKVRRVMPAGRQQVARA